MRGVYQEGALQMVHTQVETDQGWTSRWGETGRVHQSGANMTLFCWGQHNML